MHIEFTKMHGIGNDFVIIDALSNPRQLTAENVHLLADRHFGVGCDQVLVVEPANNPQADFFYRIFNADGSEAEQCGNGARCFARFVYEKGLTKKKQITLETACGITWTQIEHDNQVSVNMGTPQPLDLASAQLIEAPSTYKLAVAGQEVVLTAVSMGNPHVVIVVDDISQAPVNSLGAGIAGRDNIFPQGVNVGFMQVCNENHIKLRVYERGSGETLACGTGACAAVYAAHNRGLAGDHVKVDLPGGALTIVWVEGQQALWMTGPATFVFTGNIEL